MKKCSKCKQVKPFEEFSKNKARYDGFQNHCKICNANLRANSEFKKYSKKYRTEYYQISEVKERQRKLQQSLKYKIKAKEHRQSQEYRDLKKAKRQEDPQYRLKGNLRARLGSALKNGYKTGSAVSDLECSISQFQSYLEAQFHCNPETGEIMTWESYGINGWHIDHKIPLDSFDLTDRAQLLKACHYLNMQPLWSKINRQKSNKISMV